MKQFSVADLTDEGAAIKRTIKRDAFEVDDSTLNIKRVNDYRMKSAVKRSTSPLKLDHYIDDSDIMRVVGEIRNGD